MSVKILKKISTFNRTLIYNQNILKIRPLVRPSTISVLVMNICQPYANFSKIACVSIILYWIFSFKKKKGYTYINYCWCTGNTLCLLFTNSFNLFLLFLLFWSWSTALNLRKQIMNISIARSMYTEGGGWKSEMFDWNLKNIIFEIRTNCINYCTIVHFTIIVHFTFYKKNEKKTIFLRASLKITM